MKQLSRWAKNNKWQARIIMTIAWILLTGLAIIIGMALSELQVTVPGTALLIMVAVFLASVFYYPSRSQKAAGTVSKFYRKQKTCDLLIAVCSFGLTMYAANKPTTLFQHYGNLFAASSIEPSLPKDSTAKTYKSIKEFSAAMRDEDGKSLKWKEKKKLLKQQVKDIKRSSEGAAEKTLLIILSVLVALGLLYLVGVLACNLSCNGSDAAAVIVAIGGTGLVIFLFILTVRAILGKKKKAKMGSVKPATD